jgi:hypothetical protein
MPTTGIQRNLDLHDDEQKSKIFFTSKSMPHMHVKYIHEKKGAKKPAPLPLSETILRLPLGSFETCLDRNGAGREPLQIITFFNSYHSLCPIVGKNNFLLG